MDCMLNLLVYELQEAQFPSQLAAPDLRSGAGLDGDILIAPITPRNFAALCEVTGQASSPMTRDSSRCRRGARIGPR